MNGEEHHPLAGLAETLDQLCASSETKAAAWREIQTRRPQLDSLEDFALKAMFDHLLTRYVIEGNLVEAVVMLHSTFGFEFPEAQLAKPRAPSSWVYFIQAGEGGQIKIGRARDVVKRMADIQNGCPHALRLLVAVPGGKDVELAFHKEFAGHRIRREWFLPAPEIRKRINELAEQTAEHPSEGS